MNKNKYNYILVVLIAIVVGLLIYVFLNNKIEITDITLDNTNITMIINEKKPINATIIPPDATDKNILWESSDESVAIVDNGVVTGIGVGDTIITVKSKNGHVFNKCLVKVLPQEADNIEFIQSEIGIQSGETKELNLTIIPDEFRKDVVWNSSDPSIATVNSNGIVTGITTGKTIITATYGEKEAICEVRVIIPVDSLKMEKESVSLEVDKTATLNLIIEPSTAINQEIKWESSNADIASVSDGVVLGKKIGTVTITATISGKKASCKVIVSTSVDEIKLNKTSISINEGESETLVATITPSNSTNKTITWSSSDTKIATVDNNGKVTGKGTGTAIITASIEGKTATCEVKSIGYVITNDKKYSKYSDVVSYKSDTFKYRIIKYQGQHIVLIWVMDASNQMNSALAKKDASAATSTKTILANEISKYGYQKKGLVAVNASFHSPPDKESATPLGGVVISHGKIAKNTGKSADVIGINSDGILTSYKNKTASAILNSGVKNTFVISGIASNDNNTYKTERTQICQYDKNNFVLLVGFGNVKTPAAQIKELTGCSKTYNLDGGKSSKLYYKKSNSSKAIQLSGGNRIMPDMLYFVEQ